MKAASLLETLRSHRVLLSQHGVKSLSIFGSVARGDDTAASDLDVAVTLAPETAQSGFRYFSQLEGIKSTLESATGMQVHILAEPVQSSAFRESLKREKILAF
jgi:hypothetical protein